MKGLWLLLLVGCGAAPTPGPSVEGYPLPAEVVKAKRVPLYVQGLEMVHQVALDLPERSDVMIGRMRFPAAEQYHLQAQTPFGMDLFVLRKGADGYHAEVADPLKGRFPAEGLAHEIGRIYLGACAGGVAEVDGGYELRCEGLTERLDGRTLAVTRRTYTEPSGRQVVISYDEYGWFGERWLPARIRLVTGDYKVEVVLTEAT